eukprot:gene7775-7973_t
MQQQQWQDLQFVHDTCDGRLNSIQLSVLLLQLSRVAPAPEMLTAAERRQLQHFVQQVVLAGIQKLHSFDHHSLATFAQAIQVARSLPGAVWAQRLSVAGNYRQLGVKQLPQPVQLAFDRDASATNHANVAYQ